MVVSHMATGVTRLLYQPVQRVHRESRVFLQNRKGVIALKQSDRRWNQCQQPTDYQYAEQLTHQHLNQGKSLLDSHGSHPFPFVSLQKSRPRTHRRFAAARTGWLGQQAE